MMLQPFEEDKNLDIIEKCDGYEILDDAEGVAGFFGWLIDSWESQNPIASLIFNVDEYLGEGKEENDDN